MEPSDNKTAGYRRPPKHTQWKKGQSGNPRKIRGKNAKKIWQVVESIFAMQVAISENGQKRTGSIFEGIVLQLWMKATSGNKRAFRVFRRYEEFAKTLPDFYVEAEIDAAKAAESYAQMLKEGL